MKLVAAVPVRNERARYLEPCVAHLLEFCDEVRILDDASDDGWAGLFLSEPRVRAYRRERKGAEAFGSHAAARNQLLRFALEAEPDVLLQIDADEFVADGPAVRRALEQAPQARAWALDMQEIWEAYDECLCVRQDGGWQAHPVTMLWRPQAARRRAYQIKDQGHATGRTPVGVSGGACIGEVLHLGWCREAERAARYARYSEGDRGRFHASAHIESIAWPRERVRLEARGWPAGLEPWRDDLRARASGARV